MTCQRCGADRLVLTFAPGSPDAAGVVCLTCGCWTDGDPVPLPDAGRPGLVRCGCQPDLDGGFSRTCDSCGTTWAGARCIHDGHQDPCPECSVSPVPQPG